MFESVLTIALFLMAVLAPVLVPAAIHAVHFIGHWPPSSSRSQRLAFRGSLYPARRILPTYNLRQVSARKIQRPDEIGAPDRSPDAHTAIAVSRTARINHRRTALPADG